MHRIIILALLIFMSAVLHAQNKADSTQQLEEVLITAQRTAQLQQSIPYAVNKKGSPQLQQLMPRTTPEALQGTSGVFIQKTNHGGGSAFVRGLTGNQTLLLMDGIRLNNATYRYGPNQYLNTIDPFLIHSIEVAKGTGAVQYGSDAMGGVIHLLSQDVHFATGKNNWSGKALVKYMSDDMEKTGRAVINYAAEKMAITAGISLRNFGDLVGGDTTGIQSPSGYGEWAFNAKAKFLLNPSMQLTFSHQQLRQAHVPIYHKVQLENFALNEFGLQKNQLQYARLAITIKQAWASTITLTASHQQSNEGRSSRKNGSSILRNEKDKVNTAGFTLEVISRLAKYWSANSGIELYRDKVHSTTTDTDLLTATPVEKRGLYPNASSYGNYSLYSLHHFKYKRWVADAGMRLNSFSIRLQDTSLGKVHITPTAMVYNAAIGYEFFPKHHIYASYSTGYRAPNIDDMGTLGIVDFRYELPAASLNPEKSANMELGYKFKTAKLKGELALYQMQLQDIITRVKEEGSIINGYPVYRKENMEAAYLKGAEAALTWSPLKRLHISGNLTYIYGQNKTKQEPMRRIPPMHGSVSGTYKAKRWYSSAEWLFAGYQTRLAKGDKEDNRIPIGGTPGYKIINLYAGITYKQMNLSTGLQNIFNEDYRTHGSGINGVGRSAWLAMAYNF